MVKRTVGVLGVLSLVLVMAGTSMAFLPCCDLCLDVCKTPCFGGQECCAPPPMYVPVPCCEPVQKTIVKKWQVKIVGPCPPASAPACGTSCGAANDKGGLLMSLAGALPCCCDFLVSFDGVYGCLGGGGCGTPCGTCAGPAARFFGAFGNAPFTFFGGLW